MTPKRWAQLKNLYGSILEQPPEERQKMLGGIREIDPSLCAELESLLAQSAHPAEGPGGNETFTPAIQPRVIEAAIACQLPVYKPAELAVLTRLPESAGLAAMSGQPVDVAPEPVSQPGPQLEFPLDEQGRMHPLDLQLRVSCPDFSPKSLIQEIQVSPAADSPVCSIAIAPRVLGELVVHLEVCHGEVVLASRSFKTEVRPSERYIADATRVVAAVGISVLARSAEIAPMTAQEQGEMSETLEIPATPPDTNEVSHDEVPVTAAQVGASVPQEAEFSRMMAAGDYAEEPAARPLAAAAPGGSAPLIEEDAGEAPTLDSAPAAPAAPASPRAKHSPWLVVMAILGPIFLLALGLLAYLAMRKK